MTQNLANNIQETNWSIPGDLKLFSPRVGDLKKKEKNPAKFIGSHILKQFLTLSVPVHEER